MAGQLLRLGDDRRQSPMDVASLGLVELAVGLRRQERVREPDVVAGDGQHGGGLGGGQPGASGLDSERRLEQWGRWLRQRRGVDQHGARVGRQ